MRTHFLHVAVLSLVLGFFGTPARGQCDPAWWGGFAGMLPDDVVWDVVEYDADGDGPGSGAVVVCGAFTTIGGEKMPHVARWDGTRFEPMDGGTNGTVYALEVWDPDGEGPEDPLLIAAGEFTAAGQTDANRIASWDGSSWSKLGSGLGAGGLSTMGLSLCAVDGEALYVGGTFRVAGEVLASQVARWDGDSWSALGSGIDGSFARVWALEMYRGDLVAGGVFSVAGGVPASNIARWDGSAWSSMDAGVDGAVFDLLEHGSRLIAGGDFSRAGGLDVGGVAAWESSAGWSGLLGGVRGTAYPHVSSLLELDPDGPGPFAPVVYAGGSFTSAGGRSVENIGAWTGSSWERVAPGLSGSAIDVPGYVPEVLRMLRVLPGGVDGSNGGLLVASTFASGAGSDGLVATGYLARYGAPRPTVAILAERTSVREGQPWSATGVIAHAEGAVSMQWLHDGSAVNPDGAGSDPVGTMFEIQSVGREDTGAYTLEVTDACGVVRSAPILLEVVCPGDFDANGRLTTTDILDFLGVWTASEPGGEVNGDGYFTVGDILDFLEAWIACRG